MKKLIIAALAAIALCLGAVGSAAATPTNTTFDRSVGGGFCTWDYKYGTGLDGYPYVSFKNTTPQGAYTDCFVSNATIFSVSGANRTSKHCTWSPAPSDFNWHTCRDTAHGGWAGWAADWGTFGNANVAPYESCVAVLEASAYDGRPEGAWSYLSGSGC